MLTNEYFDKSTQKAFMPTTPGCTEHHMKLATILNDAKRRHRSLAVCWMDLQNAYGSVHHSLIMYSLEHYHAPAKLLRLVDSLYAGLAARISSAAWSTPLVPLKVGVFQGDPFSVVIFNTVINTMVDTLQMKGYQVAQSQLPVSLLQYADDSCLIGNSPASCQHLVDTTATWFQWSGMKAKISKCASLGLQASSGKKINPMLLLDGQPIPYTPDGVKFLGMHINVPADQAKHKITVKSKLDTMLREVDACPLTRKQKLLVYRAGVCPRLTWLLTIEELPITWVEKNLDTLASRYLKKWSGLARAANNSLLYLSATKGGLNLPLISSLHKKLQVSRQCQVLTSPDPCVRHMAEKALQKDFSLSRPKFRASREVREAMTHNPDFTRKSLRETVKHHINQQEDSHLLVSLQSLEKQGHMSRCSSPDGANVWAKALEGVKDEHLKFALNSAVDTLSHNANLQLWKKRDSGACPLCAERQTIIHVLNACKVARDDRRYNSRHDSVLTEIVQLLSSYTQPPATLISDLGNYAFPQHIVATDLRPDIVHWNDMARKVLFIELTICFETSFSNAEERKEAKYEDLVARAKSSGYNAQVISLEVGSRGLVRYNGFEKLKKEFNIHKKDLSSSLINVSRRAIIESYKIWCRRNTQPHHYSTVPTT